MKQVDTLAAEFPASTNYLYMTYSGNEDDIEKEEMVRRDVAGYDKTIHNFMTRFCTDKIHADRRREGKGQT